MFRQVVALCVFFAFLENSLLAQSDESTFYFHSTSAVQYGYGVKASISFPAGGEEKIHIRATLSGGIGAFVGNNWLYPSLNADLMFYHGGFGSSRPGIKRNWLDADFVIAYTATAGWKNRMNEVSAVRVGERNYPLYYFSTWSQPSLQNPYNYSASLGGNIIFLLTKGRTAIRQLVGFSNIHVDRFQVNYYNDGPFFFPPIADMFDRYYTGGGFVSFHGNDKAVVNLVELGYHKFTGYSPSSYEVSNRFGNSYVLYKDKNQHYYNKSTWQFTIANTTVAHAGITLNLLNFDQIDVQHTIHTKEFYSFHLVPYKSSWNVAPVGYYNLVHVGQQ